MAQSPDDNAGDGEKAEPEAVKSHDNSEHHDRKTADRNLPMVVAPRLGAGEDETVEEPLGEPADETVTATAPAHTSRFLALAATVAFAAAFGSFIGSVSGSGMARFIYPASPAPETQSASATGDTLRTMRQQLAELSTAVKTNLDSASHNTTTQFAKIAERLDRIDQHAGTSETTGSITPVPPAAPSPPATQQAKLTDHVLEDWVVQDVQNGRALVESRYGGVFDVGAGSVLPGIGRIDGIKRQDGQWIVLTARGTITSTGH